MRAVILIVEDDQKNMKLIHDLLNLKGYQTIEANDGRKGVELARGKKPDLILMDIQMPVMDGFEAVKILKKDKNTKDIPIVALTAYAMPGDEEKALEAGFSGYITKPINSEEFLRKVKEFLNE